MRNATRNSASAMSTALHVSASASPRQPAAPRRQGMLDGECALACQIAAAKSPSVLPSVLRFMFITVRFSGQVRDNIVSSSLRFTPTKKRFCTEGYRANDNFAILQKMETSDGCNAKRLIWS
jgi:hypothetical protein